MVMMLSQVGGEARQAFRAKLDAGGKFDDGEVSAGLREAAQAYLAQYSGEDAFLASVRGALVGGAVLSTAQLRGVCNKMLAGLRHALAERAGAEAGVGLAGPVGVEVPRLGTYTVVFADGAWKTVRLFTKKGASTTSVRLFTGTANDSAASYTRVGWVGVGGEFHWLQGWAQGSATPLALAIQTVLYGTDEARAAAGVAYAAASGRCYRCSRTLTVPVSLHRGVGPECAKLV